MNRKYRKRRRINGMHPFVVCAALCILLGTFFLARHMGAPPGTLSGQDEEWEGALEQKLTKEERDGSEPLFLQTDERWSGYQYGGSTISVAGCGPCCLAMTAVALTGDRKITPKKVARFSDKNGYYAKGQGSLWTLIPEGSRYLGLTAEELPLSEQRMRDTLENGGKIICAMGPGDFTTEGHFIELYQAEAGGFRVHDPNSLERSRKLWPYSEISGQIRNLWGIFCDT